MTDSDISITIILVIVVLCCTFSCGYGEGKRGMQRAATKANVAQYVADKDGNVKFEWHRQTTSLPESQIKAEEE